MDWERSALRLSVIGSLFLGLLGIAFAWLSKSSAILLDGFFSLIGFAMALLTLKVSSLVRQRSNSRFQFGYAAFSPLLNTVKGVTLLLVCAFALTGAIGALLAGGRTLNAGTALIYAAVASAGCFAVAFAQRYAGSKVHSELLPLEMRSWFIDGAMSLLVGAAFLLALLLEGSRWAHLVPYIDPGLVALLVLLVAIVPLRTIHSNVAELVMRAPDPALQREVQRRFDEATRAEPIDRSAVRMTVVGRYLYVQVQAVVGGPLAHSGMAELDRVRKNIHDALKDVHPNVEIDTMLTGDERWVESVESGSQNDQPTERMIP